VDRLHESLARFTTKKAAPHRVARGFAHPRIPKESHMTIAITLFFLSAPFAAILLGCCWSKAQTEPRNPFEKRQRWGKAVERK
jgi:hypothetical protein